MQSILIVIAVCVGLLVFCGFALRSLEKSFLRHAVRNGLRYRLVAYERVERSPLWENDVMRIWWDEHLPTNIHHGGNWELIHKFPRILCVRVDSDSFLGTIKVREGDPLWPALETAMANASWRE